jgi:hypothetical protein
VGSGTINHINCKVVDDLIGLSLLHLLNIFLIQPFSHIQLETLRSFDSFAFIPFKGEGGKSKENTEQKEVCIYGNILC